MIYNYEPLTITLKEKGITRIQLQKDLHLSSATMAKMNAGKAISMEVVGRICDLLQCGINKVVEITLENEPLERWSCLGKTDANGKEQTFKIYLYYHFQNSRNDYDESSYENDAIEYSETEEQKKPLTDVCLSECTEPQKAKKTTNHLTATYLYGYATPHSFNETAMYTWYLSRGKGKFKEFYKLDGTLYANDLRKLLDAAKHCCTLKEIRELLVVTIRKEEKLNEDTENAILNSQICNGQFVYRPPFYLSPDIALIGLRKDCRPMASFFSDETTVCECFYGINKQQYYFDYDAKQPDQQKAQLLWEYLTEELPLHGSINEMARLGNFEVLTRPHSFSEKLVTCELWCENDIPAGVEVAVSKKLTGKHILQVKLSNSSNAMFDNAYIIDPQNNAENPLRIPLSESYFCAELKLWSLCVANTGARRLLFDSCTTYIREIKSSLNITERSFKLEDNWTRAMTRQKKSVSTNVSFCTNINMKPLVNPQQEPWITEEYIVQDDYRELQERIYSPHSKDAFFPKGVDRIILFLKWLKNRLTNLPDATRVLLFDPYINNTAIYKFIHNISNPAVQYEIITDSNPTGEKERTKQIEEIRNLPVSLCYICYPCRLRVRTVTYKEGLLHDRVLIIAGPETAEVYILSNSLDAMAKKHSSTLTAVHPDVVKEIVDSYATLVKQAEKDGEIDTLFDTTKPIPESPADEDTISYKEGDSGCEDEEYYTLEDFRRDYSSNATETALDGLAYMYSKEKSDCFSYIMSLNADEEYNKLETFLKEKIKSLPAPRLDTGYDVLMHNILAEADGLTHLPGSVGKICHPFYVLIDNASTAIDWSFKNKRAVPDACYYAVSILWKLSAEKFVQLLEELIEERKKEKIKDSNNEAMPTAVACVIYTIIKHIIRGVAVPDEKASNFNVLINSHTPYLRAIFAAKALRFDEVFLTALIQGKHPDADADLLITSVKNKCTLLTQVMKAEEACLALLFMFTRLQMLCKRGQTVACKTQILLDEIVTVYVDMVIKHIKSDVSSLKQQLAPLNSFNPEDIIRIIEKLQQFNYLTAEQEYEILLHFWKLIYDKENGKEMAYYNEKTIQYSNLIACYISQKSKSSAKKLLNEITNRVRKHCALLYDPLLYTKNYNKWKNAVDQCACLLITERQIVSQYESLTIGKGEAEYEKLTENYTEMLEKCSKVYRMWKE